MKLTREQAIRDYRAHWDWLSWNPSKKKEEYPGLKRYEKPINQNCFLCEYTDMKCSECLVVWPNTKAISLACTNSIYGEWEDSTTPEERSRLAALIRDLPIKEEEKPAPKFAVGDKVVPVSKNAGCSWAEWVEDDDYVHQFFIKYGFLYITRIDNYFNLNDGSKNSFDFFLESDLIPYVEPPKSKFKVGDIVTGNSENVYDITNADMAKGEVVNVRNNGDIDVKVLEHKCPSFMNEHVYPELDEKDFDLVVDEPKEVKPEPAFKVGDRVRVKPTGFHAGRVGVISGQKINEPHYNNASSDVYGIRGNSPLNNNSGDWDKNHPTEKGMGWYEFARNIELLPLSNQAPEPKTLTSSTTFIFKGNRTTCIIEIDGDKFIGKAKCSPADEWEESMGKDLAYIRATRKMVNWQEKQLTGRG